MLALILFCKWREVKKQRDNCQMDSIICKSMLIRRHPRFYICFVYNVLVGLDRTQLVLNNWRKKQGLHLHYLPCMYQGNYIREVQVSRMTHPPLKIGVNFQVFIERAHPAFLLISDYTVVGSSHEVNNLPMVVLVFV